MQHDEGPNEMQIMPHSLRNKLLVEENKLLNMK